MSDTDTPSTVLTPLPVHGYTKQPESNVASATTPAPTSKD